MKILSYEFREVPYTSAATLTEYVNGALTKLNEDEPVRGDAPPYWEMTADPVFIRSGLVLLTFGRWQR